MMDTQDVAKAFKKAMVVDDDVVARSGIKYFFDLAGYTVIVAKSGFEAIRPLSKLTI